MLIFTSFFEFYYVKQIFYDIMSLQRVGDHSVLFDIQ